MSPAQARAVTAWGLGLGALVLYACTLFPGVGGQLNHGDSAKFQYLGAVLGVGHPPGNPLYLGLLGLAQRVPLGSAALRANVVSALCAAAAVGLTADSAYRLRGPLAAWVAAASVALGAVFWTFATEAEVYALSGLMVAAVLHGLVRLDAALAEGRPSAAGGAGAFALGLANHLSLAFAAPALCWALVHAYRRGARPARGAVLGALACVALGALAYALLPVVHAHAVYSEYRVPAGLAGFVEFVTAKKYQGHFQLPSLEAFLFARPAWVAGLLLQQWTAPLWLVLPASIAALWRTAPCTARFASAATLAWLIFLFLYDIPDPQGVLVAIACASAPALGVAVAELARPALGAAALGAALAPLAYFHAAGARGAVPFDLYEDVLGSPEREVLDFAELVGRIPAGAALTQPCVHYGCAQVTNYYRFADATVRARRIRIVSLAGSIVSWQPDSAPRLDPSAARTRVVCTVRPEEAESLARAGARVERHERGQAWIAGAPQSRLPVYCSVPTP